MGFDRPLQGFFPEPPPTDFDIVLRGYDRAIVNRAVRRIQRVLAGEAVDGPPATGAEVRSVRFPLVLRGYDRRQVDELMEGFAQELDQQGRG